MKIARAKWKGKWDRGNPLDIIKRYANKPGVFLHLSALGPTSKGPVGDRLGINPKTEWQTPQGIYGYPLNTQSVQQLMSNTLPFKGDAPWVHLFQVKLSKFLLTSKYSEADYQRDKAILQKMFPSKNYVLRAPTALNSHVHVKALNANNRNMVFWIQAGKPKHYTHQEALKVKEAILNAKPQGYSIRTNYLGTDTFWREVEVVEVDSISEWEKDAAINLPAGRLFNVTRNLAKENINKWNKLFRLLGYQGVYDDACTGVIHQNEKCQAVVFSTTFLKRLEVVPNPSIYENWSVYRNEPSSYLKAFKKYGHIDTKREIASMTVASPVGEMDFILSREYSSLHAVKYIYKQGEGRFRRLQDQTSLEEAAKEAARFYSSLKAPKPDGWKEAFGHWIYETKAIPWRMEIAEKKDSFALLFPDKKPLSFNTLEEAKKMGFKLLMEHIKKSNRGLPVWRV